MQKNQGLWLPRPSARWIAFVVAYALMACPDSGSAADIGDGRRIDWYVISGGGHKEATSANRRLRGSIAQPVIGMSTSVRFALDAGFWVSTGKPRLGSIFSDGFEEREQTQ